MTREYQYDMNYCKHCGQRFESKYPNAKFCTDAHRVAFHRKSKQAETLARKILKDIQTLQNLPVATESVSSYALRIQKIAGRIADEWEYVRPLEAVNSK